MFMTNIPRRKIYEKMLEFEDILMDMQILLLNEKNFEQRIDKFEKRIPEIIDIYKEVKVLIVLFLENKKFEKAEDFQKTINEMKKQITLINEKIQQNKNITQSFLTNLKVLNEKLKQNFKIRTIQEGKILFEDLDEFNSHIPLLLEIRRDKMK